jgi:hypothetical protein
MQTEGIISWLMVGLIASNLLQTRFDTYAYLVGVCLCPDRALIEALGAIEILLSDVCNGFETRQTGIFLLAAWTGGTGKVAFEGGDEAGIHSIDKEVPVNVCEGGQNEGETW